MKAPLTAQLEKIVVNAGIGRASTQANFEEKFLVQALRDLGLITGQKAEIRKARKSIAGFKIRENQVIGLKVTLRRAKMVDFFERFTRMVVPRIRDFAGIDPTNVDARGVLNMGIREQYVFPEVNPEESFTTFSLGVTIVPKTRDRKKAMALYTDLKIPFKH
jgi:large subunit ribosomal protein L5